MTAEVQFPDGAGPVTLFLEDPGDGDFVGMDALCVAKHQDRVPGTGLRAVPDRIGPGHQRRSRGVQTGAA